MLSQDLLRKAKSKKLTLDDVPEALGQILVKVEAINGKLEAMEVKMADLTMRMLDIETKCSELENESPNIESKILTQLANAMEFKDAQKTILISGMQLHANAKKGNRHETMQESYQLTNDLFKSMKMEAIYFSAFRFQKKENKDGKPPIMRISFVSRDDKRVFYHYLAKNAKKLKGLIVRDFCPQYLKEDYQFAQKTAYELRKIEGTKTKIIIKEEGISILERKKGEREFKEYCPEASEVNEYECE